MIPAWKDALYKDPRLSIADAMQSEINALRKSNDELRKELGFHVQYVEMLQKENIEQWDEIVQLKDDAKDHDAIVRIYMAKAARLGATQ